MPSKKRARRLRVGEARRLQPIREKLVERAIAKGGLSSFALIRGEDVRMKANRICYAHVHGSGYNTEPLDYFIDWSFFPALCRTDGTKPRSFTPLEERWLTWVACESVWAPVFITKDLEEMHSLGIVFNTAYPAQYVIQGAIAARYISEAPDIVKWWDLIRAIMDPHLALHFAHSLEQINEYLFTLDETGHGNTGHHVWKFTDHDIQSLRRVIDGRLLKGKLKSFRENTDYFGLNQIWGPALRRREALLLPTPETVTYLVFGHKRTIQGYSMERFDEVMREALIINKLVEYEVK